MSASERPSIKHSVSRRRRYLAVLNDDATAHPGWLEALLAAMEPRPDVGMCASQVRMRATAAWIRRACCFAWTEAASSVGIWNRPRPMRAKKRRSCRAAPRLYIAAKCWKKSASSMRAFSCIARTPIWACARAGPAGNACTFPSAVVEHRYSHSSGKASALKAYYVERNRLFVIFKNFPLLDLLLVPFYAMSRYFWHFIYALRGRGKAAEFQREGGSFLRLPWYVIRGHFELLVAISRDLATAPRDEAPANRQTISPPDPALFHQSPSGGRAVKPAGGPEQLLILIPAFNEVGAIAGVIQEVRGVVPEAPILVVDDASTDGTDRSARSAGADVLRLPYHLGLGGGVQAGYKLAYELGYEYVIRVDGDGQHDPKYIPDLLKTLRETGCHMVIGSRFQNGNGDLHQLRSRPGHLVFSAGAAAHPGKTGARSYFGIRRREPPGVAGFHRQFSVGISGNRGAGGSAAQALPVPGSALPRCVRAKLAAAPSPR